MLENVKSLWENFRYGDASTTEGTTSTSVTSQQPIPIGNLVAIPSVASAAVSDAFKAALIETVARNVPVLKDLLENAALIADDLPDLGARMRLVVKQAKLSPDSLTELLSQTDDAVASVIQQVMGEVANEEREKITAPSERLTTLRATKQAKEQELNSLTDQINQAEVSLQNAEREIATSREKSQIGAHILQSWSSEMKNFLTSKK